MQYAIEVSGRRRLVSVARSGDGFAISVDGRHYRVDVVRIDAQTPLALSLIVDSDVAEGPQGRNSYKVTVAPAAGATGAHGAGRLTVQIGSTPVDVVVGPDGSAADVERGGDASAGPERVTAPMPGRIVRVLVGAGDVVRARDPLLVVEAMKMENELRAARDGTVAEVHAREGSTVDAGALLMVIR